MWLNICTLVAFLVFDYEHLKLLAPQRQMLKKRVNPSAKDPIIEHSEPAAKWVIHIILQFRYFKPLKFMFFSPFHLPITVIKRCAPLFPFIADSDNNSSARFIFWLVPRPSAQHSASITMASVSLQATHSSRSNTAFSSFFSPLFSSSLFATFFFASMDACDSESLWSVVLCVLVSFLIFIVYDVCVF